MDPNIIGQLAAILTSFLWTINSILFASAGKKIGSISVNAYRILMAVIFLSITHLILFGNILPIASNEQWLWIGLSGIIGLGLGDFGLFAAFVIIGPRLSVLIMSLSPIFAAVGAYFMLGEILGLYSIIGIIITLIGVSIVVLEKSDDKTISNRFKIWGVFLALIGAFGQGIGIVFAKKGILFESTTILNPLSTSLIRMILGAIFIWICVVAAGKTSKLIIALKNKDGMKSTIAGAFIGPFLGVTFSMIAVTLTQVGIAQTLMSIMPVMIIPIVWLLYRHKTNMRGILGAFIAVAGVAILFLL